LERLKNLKDQEVIKVITGVRRCGKSTLLGLFRTELIEQGVSPKQIQSYNFEEEANYDLRNWRKLHHIIESKLVSDKRNYIFLDEVQKVEQFEELTDSLFTKDNVDLYITGSNAFLLSGELTTLLTGRYISIHILPFSFQEYSDFFGSAETPDRLFAKYLGSSAFPEVMNLGQVDQQLANNYLADLYDTIVNKDIAERYEIRGKADFEKVVKFMASSIGSPISARNVSQTLRNNGSHTFHTSVIRYLEYLTKSYLLYPVSRYDLKGKKLLQTNDKYYFVDLGLRNLLLGSSLDSDLGHRLENVVYLELLKRNEGEVFVGKTEDLEVDFMVQKANGQRIYYQVAFQVNDRPETLERELAPFWKLADNYPKYLLTTDLISEQFDGIQKVNVVDWLLEK
jgi:predicted AAA+ superfamily ATPase